LIPENAINNPINPYLLQIFLVGARGTKEQKRGNNEQERLMIMILEVDCLVGIQPCTWLSTEIEKFCFDYCSISESR
jgi:hypothetical protein